MDGRVADCIGLCPQYGNEHVAPVWYGQDGKGRGRGYVRRYELQGRRP